MPWCCRCAQPHFYFFPAKNGHPTHKTHLGHTKLHIKHTTRIVQQGNGVLCPLARQPIKSCIHFSWVGSGIMASFSLSPFPPSWTYMSHPWLKSTRQKIAQSVSKFPPPFHAPFFLFSNTSPLKMPRSPFQKPRNEKMPLWFWLCPLLNEIFLIGNHSTCF